MTKRLKTKHRLYGCWIDMKQRCRNKNYKDYKYYGARGIDVCDEWYDDFWSYAEYMESLPGYGEPGLSVDRIDNNKGYFSGNIRWATKSQQMFNRGRWGKGYYRHIDRRRKDKEMWRVRFRVDGVCKSFGLYDTEEEAIAKVAELRKKYDGESK